MIKTQKQIKLKDGNTLEIGLPVKFVEGNATRCFVQGARFEPYQVRVTSAFVAPSLRSLEKYSYDGIAKSVGGKRVEPDGWDENNSPSWLLALGLI